MKIRRLMMSLFLSTMLMFSACELTIAQDLVGPVAPAGNFLSVHYSPSGGTLSFLDSTEDGVCDSAMIHGFLPAEERMVYIRMITCEEGSTVLAVATKLWEHHGFKPMVYDKDLGRLVPVK